MRVLASCFLELWFSATRWLPPVLPEISFHIMTFSPARMTVSQLSPRYIR